MSDLTRLSKHLATYPSMLVGYSGGVDSALVSVVGRQVLGRERMAAAIGISASLPREQRDRASAMARQFDLTLIEVATGELDDSAYVANDPSRCYYCKRELWRRLTRVARERGFVFVVDGANADDVGDHRPGLRASEEFGIRSPLIEVGYSKADVRAEAHALGIPVWDAPAAPCLSSRIMYGLEVSPTRLRQVEESERVLRGLGVEGDLRVRHRGTEARIEVQASEFRRIRTNRAWIADQLRELGFERVTLDLRGYRRGSLLAGEPRDVEVLAGS